LQRNLGGQLVANKVPAGGQCMAAALLFSVGCVVCLQVGRVLMISKASLKPRNARFNNTPHEFEIYLERNSSIAPCEDDADTAAIPHIMFNVSLGVVAFAVT
jgi:hypothetical protein